MTDTSVQKVSLAFLKEQARPVYPAPKNWDATIDFMLNDKVEAERINHLLEVLNQGGSFREPIYVGRDLEDEDDAGYHVYNGTHRMVAHILNNSGFIEVVYEQEDEEEDTVAPSASSNEYAPGKYRALSTTIEIEGDIDEEAYDNFFSVLRSFRLSNDVWITSDMMSSTSGDKGLKMMFGWDLTEANSAFMDTINDICIERIQRFTQIVPLSVSTEYDYWTDED